MIEFVVYIICESYINFYLLFENIILKPCYNVIILMQYFVSISMHWYFTKVISDFSNCDQVAGYWSNPVCNLKHSGFGAESLLSFRNRTNVMEMRPAKGPLNAREPDGIRPRFYANEKNRNFSPFG